jgi:phosphate transport system substrate-binding protein
VTIHSLRPLARRAIAAGVGLASLLLGACSGSDGGSGVFRAVDLTGAGATFINPIMTKWTSDYAGLTGIRVNYQSIGSGGGIRQLSENVVDFGASDSPMTPSEEANAKGGKVLHLPIIIGSVVLAYNLPGMEQQLRLSGDLVADMYLGEITRWNDPRIAALNPGVELPDRDVLPVYRTDGSGTTFIFTSFLGSTSERWKAGPGVSKAVRWPRGVGLGGKGNEGVAMLVQDTPGAIGYTEYAYASQNGLSMAAIRSAGGHFVPPTIEATMAAADAALASVPDTSDLKLSLINQPHEAAYPIASFSWLLVYEQQTDTMKARKLADFIRWAVTEGDDQARALEYAPIPPKLVNIVLERLDRISPPDSVSSDSGALTP